MSNRTAIHLTRPAALGVRASLRRDMPAVNLSTPPGVRVRGEAGDDAAVMRDLAGLVKSKTDELNVFAERAKADLQGFNGRLTHVEQRLARRVGGGGAPTMGGFRAALDDDGVRQAIDGVVRHGRANFSINSAILSTPPDGAPPAADRRAEIAALPQRALRVRDLFGAPVPTTEGSVEFIRETGFVNAAAPVAEGATKPDSSITFELVNLPVRTIAHWLQASKQVLSDLRSLAAFLDGRMRYGLQLAEDDQLLLADGTGQSLSGVIPLATAFAAPTGVPVDNRADEIGAAFAQLRAIDVEPDGAVLHPTDWAIITQSKDAEGRYLVPGGPFSTAPPILFGKPLALTTAMPLGEFLVGNFMIGGDLYEREETTVELSREDRDNFVKNLVTVLAEERVLLAVTRPEAFVAGAFTPET